MGKNFGQIFFGGLLLFVLSNLVFPGWLGFNILAAISPGLGGSSVQPIYYLLEDCRDDQLSGAIKRKMPEMLVLIDSLGRVAIPDKDVAGRTGLRPFSFVEFSPDQVNEGSRVAKMVVYHHTDNGGYWVNMAFFRVGSDKSLVQTGNWVRIFIHSGETPGDTVQTIGKMLAMAY